MNLRSLLLLLCCSIISLRSMAQCNDPFTLDPTPAVVCSGSGFQLDATPYPGATYTWTGPVGSGVNTNTSSSASFASASAVTHDGMYTVTATLPDGCVYTATYLMHVQTTPSKPTVTFKSPICPYDDEVMAANTLGASGITFFWSGPNAYSFNSAATNVAVVEDIPPAGEGIYSVYAVSAQGCKSETATFFIDVHPEVVAAFNPQLLLGCDKDSVNLTNTSTGASSTHWDFGDGNTSADVSTKHTYYTQGTYKVTLISGNGFCYDTTEQNITFNHSITAGFTINDDSICQGTAINFTNTSSMVPAGIPLADWSFGDGFTNNTKVDEVHTYTNYGIYTAILVATDAYGCKDTFERSILVDSAGSINFTASQTEICPGTSIDFKGTFMEWQSKGATWDMGDGNVLPDLTEHTYTYYEEGVYAVTYIANYRICPAVQYVQNITVKPQPSINLGPDADICPNGQPLTLVDLVNDGNDKATWQWCDEAKSTTSSAIIRHAGTYSATVEIDGCSSTDTVVVKNNCFLNIPNVFSPNGDGNSDYFLPRQFLAKGVQSFDMQIFNRWGQQVFATNKTNGRGWDGTYNNVEQPMGVYIYLINVSFVNGTQEHYDGNLTLLR
ncbi:MAG: PKD domain-containing protein [Sphingobacteriales bacterium]|nr:MAG: PKD domain-containing protein [Sphingobacteriales bacterium]